MIRLLYFVLFLGFINTFPMELIFEMEYTAPISEYIKYNFNPDSIEELKSCDKVQYDNYVDTYKKELCNFAYNCFNELDNYLADKIKDALQRKIVDDQEYGANHTYQVIFSLLTSSLYKISDHFKVSLQDNAKLAEIKSILNIYESSKSTLDLHNLDISIILLNNKNLYYRYVAIVSSKQPLTISYNISPKEISSSYLILLAPTFNFDLGTLDFILQHDLEFKNDDWDMFYEKKYTETFFKILIQVINIKSKNIVAYDIKPDILKNHIDLYKQNVFLSKFNAKQIDKESLYVYDILPKDKETINLIIELIKLSKKHGLKNTSYIIDRLLASFSHIEPIVKELTFYYK